MGRSEGGPEGQRSPEDEERDHEEARALAELLSGRRRRTHGMEPPPELGDGAPADSAAQPPSQTAPPSPAALAEEPLIGTAEPFQGEPSPAIPEAPPMTTSRRPSGARRVLAVTGVVLLVVWVVSVPLVGAWWLERERARAERLATESADLRARVTELSSELSILRAELGLLREEMDSLQEESLPEG